MCDLLVYRRTVTSVTIWIQKRANLCGWSLEPSTFEQLFNLKTSDLFTGALVIYLCTWLFNDLLVFPLISLTNRFFCDGTIVLPAWKPLSYRPRFPVPIFTPSPPSSYPFSYSSSPRRYGTVRFSRRFHPQSTPDNSNLQTFREIEIKSEWNYVRISKTKPPPPQIPPHLRRLNVNLLTKLVSR